MSSSTKAKMDRRSQERQAPAFDDEGPVTFITSRGVKVECLPIAAEIEAQENNIRSGIDWPEVPTREVSDVAGSVMHFSYTDESIKDAPEEAKQAWEKYQADLFAAQHEFDARIGEGRPRLIAYRGIRLVDESLPAKWEKEHEWLGMTIPETPHERALHFFQTEILGNPTTDLYGILLGIYKASGYSDELLEKAEAFFRSQMGRGDGTDAGADPGDSGTEAKAGA